MVDFKRYSNKKIILGIYILTFITLFLLGVDGGTIGGIIGSYFRISILNILFMAMPAFPLAIYNRIINKSFFISKQMIKVSFIIGLILTVLNVLTYESIPVLGTLLALICLAISFFRENPKEVSKK